MAISALSQPSVAADIACVDAPVFVPSASSKTINIADEAALQKAVATLEPNTRLLLAPGKYVLSKTLGVEVDNVTISGDSERCDEIILIGSGMDKWHGFKTIEHGIWTDSPYLTVSNLTIQQVYRHGIMVNGNADNPTLYNVRLQDNGEQLLKASPLDYAEGADNGLIEYSSFGYSDKAPQTNHGGGTGYTQGVDVHAGKGWVIRNNFFENIHTTDDADHLWNPAVLMWNGASDTVLENNRFHNVDRAIAFGLLDRKRDHMGGIIRNNMISMDADFFSPERKAAADAMIIVWSSPYTKIIHNTILTQGNTPKAIELRFGSEYVSVENNLVDAEISARHSLLFMQSNNITGARASEFRNPGTVDLRLNAPHSQYLNKGRLLDDAELDVDSERRQRDADDLYSDIGADEWLVH
ncbi:MAG: hypothetical protein V3U76_01160 [Granulosicoccus sp.]